MSIFHKIREFTSVEAKFPLVMVKNGVTVTRGGQCARVVELTGKDYSGLDAETVESFFQGRKQFFDSLPNNITVLHQSHRQVLSRDLDVESYSIPVAGDIAARWADNFSTSYRTRHFLIFVTASDSITDQLMLLVQKNKGETFADELIRILDESVENTLVQFQGYGAREVTGDALATYWAWMLNGQHLYQKMPEDGLFDNLLSGTDLQWPSGKNYQIYRNTKDRYSAWLIIKAPATITSSGLLESLFCVKREFSMYQTFSRFDKQAALDAIEDKRKNNQAFMMNIEIENELSDLYTRIQTDEISLIRHRFALEVFGDSEGELESAVREIRNSVESWGYRVARERMNQEALFWSRFPEFQDFNSRQRNMNSLNASHFATFASVGEGQESCSWGQAPVTVLKTATESEYSFIFHESTAKTALGNSMIVGGAGSGKTTFISFLISQCFKFPGFRVLAFDRLRGLEVFTNFHDGNYLDFTKGLDINPLQLPDSNDNRAFLSNWFSMLTGKHGEIDQELIGQAVMQIYDLEKTERTLTNIADAFGLKEEGSARQALNRWLPDGAFGHFFGGQRDALDFEKPLVSLDMSTLLDQPDVLGPMAYYLFHKLFLTARQDGGYLVFVDELARYLRSKEFAPKVEEILQEIRKTDGVFVGAIQSADKVLDHKLSETFKNNIATWILFSEPLADRKHYIDQLGLNEREFEWIKKDHPRQVMIKRKSGESVIVNIDLSPLGDYLKVFNSSKDAIREMNQFQEGYGHGWKEKYLAA